MLTRQDVREWLDLWADAMPMAAVALGIVVLFAAIAVAMLRAPKPGAPCDQLGEMRVADLPVRCAQHWRIK